MALYTTLGCSTDATPEQLRQAFHRAARAVHPDKGGSAERFASVAAAWRILRCAGSRRVYDASLLQSGVPVHADLPCGALVLDAAAGSLSLPCRCGGCFSLLQTDLTDTEAVLVPCDTCSLHIRVWAIP